MTDYSIDRHVDSDTRFTRGMWETKQGVNINWAAEGVKTEVQEQSSIYSVASTKNIRHRGDYLNVATISTKISSPRKGIIGVESYHHLSPYLNSKEARFDTLSEKTQCSASVTEEGAIVTAEGGISARLQNKPFNIDFIGEDLQLLTKLGFRSLGHVLDSRYPRKTLSANRASPYMTAQLHLSVGEKVFGLGERFGPFVKNGQRVEIWNEDGGTSSEWTYKNIPFYMSNRGYGVFVDSTSNIIFEVQSERTTRVNITVPGEGIRFYIVYGPDPKSILQRYAQFTGFPALPPAWTFGLWLTTSFTTNYDMKTVSSFIKGMHDRGIPLRTFHFDCFWMKGFQWCDFEFDAEFFPDPKVMLRKLKDEFGIKICVWINPYIAQESALFKEAVKNGYLIKNKNGDVYQTDRWQAGMGIVDFSNPGAYKWFQKKLSDLVDIGVDSFKTDFGERIPCKDIEFYSGEDLVSMHNYYTLLYNRSVFEVLEKKLGKNEACLFARSATTGGQKYPVHWGGDCESTFEAMSESLRGGLSLGLSGFGFWSHDIGGFEGSPDPSIYKRWCAFGLLSSHSRLHGSDSYRVPWNFDDESSIVLAKFTKLKISLMPYIFNIAINAHKNAVPVMRAMLLEYPNDSTAFTADTQYMLGDSLLVAPVFSAEGYVDYYVPGGSWYGLLDGKVRASTDGKWFKEKHNYMSLPLLVRPNSIIITSGPEHLNEKPDYAWNENFMINLYAVNENISTKIPDHRKPGEYNATVIVEAKGNKLNVSVEGDFKKPYTIRILDSKDQVIRSEKGATIIGADEHGNKLISAENGNVGLEIN
ncbi:unnamed protein product [Debaryomyces fabryi]|nr:unnamed protein product [Debaryomyces fabryi]